MLTCSDWDNPYGFFASNYTVKDSAGNIVKEITGSVGTLLGIWYVLLSFS